jgi:predicted extracellular nuclease
MQTSDARADAEADTSNKIYVFTVGPPGVAVGDQVDVTGQVAEFFEHTEFTGSPIVSVCPPRDRPMEMESASSRNSTDQFLTISRSRLRL